MVVCNRYASALFELSHDGDVLDKVYEDIFAVNEVFSENKELFDVLKTPSIEESDKIVIIDKIFKGKIHEFVRNFLCILVNKRRINLYSGICEEFKNIYSEFKNIEYAKIKTAVSLSETEKKNLLEKLSKEKIVKAEFIVDPSILGGVVVSFDDRVIDGSVKTKLSNLNKYM